MSKAKKKKAKRLADYKKYLLSDEWKALRGLVLEKFDFMCVLCKERKFLDIHHLTYRRRGRERLTDLVSLCRICHFATHKTKELNRELQDKYGIPESINVEQMLETESVRKLRQLKTT